MSALQKADLDGIHRTEQRWREMANAMKSEADRIPAGRARDGLLKKAQQLETACRMSRWVSSPGLKQPE